MALGFQNLGLLLSLKGELADEKNQDRIKLMEAVGKKKEDQKYLSLVRKAAHSHYLEQLKKEEEGQVSLTELASLLDGTEISGLSQAKDQPSQDSDLMDLLSLTNGSWGEENVDSLKKKMEDKFVRRTERIDEKLTTAAAGTVQLEKRKKITMKVDCELDGNEFLWGFILEPFSSHLPEDVNELTLHQRDSLLLSNLVFGMKERMDSAEGFRVPNMEPTCAAVSDGEELETFDVDLTTPNTVFDDEEESLMDDDTYSSSSDIEFKKMGCIDLIPPAIPIETELSEASILHSLPEDYGYLDTSFVPQRPTRISSSSDILKRI